MRNILKFITATKLWTENGSCGSCNVIDEISVYFSFTSLLHTCISQLTCDICNEIMPTVIESCKIEIEPRTESRAVE